MTRDAFAARIDVSRETLDRLTTMADLLERWSTAVNLVSRATIPAVWERHMLDSAQLYALAPAEAASWVDLGAGAGFPGLVIAAMAHDRTSPLAVTLIDSDARKCAFMAEAARAMGVAVRIETRRIEGPGARRHDVVSARALAPLSRLIEMAGPYMAPKGVLLAPKGARADDELTAARKHWHMAVAQTRSLSDDGGVILRISEVRRVAIGP